MLRKPLNEVEHGGGKKLLHGDQGYKAFRSFLEDYARTVGDRYANATALPDDQTNSVRFGTDIWLKVSNTPPDWGDKLLQVNLYAWDAHQNRWETSPVASSDREVWGGGKLWQHNLTLIAERGSERANGWMRKSPSLPQGKYLVKVYVDQRKRLAADWNAAMGDDEFVGQAEVQSSWPVGYGSMTTLEAGNVTK